MLLFLSNHAIFGFEAKITMKDQKRSRINDALNEIHKDIRAELPVKKLADVALYSEQHFHRVFQSLVGESVHAYIRRTRLEEAANQLTFSPELAVQDVAEKCGFSSLSSFTKAFKSHFLLTPGAWRKRDIQPQSQPWLADTEIAQGYERIKYLDLPMPDFIQRQPQIVAYVRHLGYGRSIRMAWQRLQAWAITERRDFSRQLGLHHSNPNWVPLDQCRYVACLEIDKPLLQRGAVNTLTLPGGLHAAFRLQGRYGELLPWISKITEEWLPTSGFRVQVTPAFVQFKKNHFLNMQEEFDLVFYLPIG